MLDQLTFDRSEDIAEALHEQAGLEVALIRTLGNHLPPDIEMVAFSLVAAMGHCRARAGAVVDQIARGNS